MPSTPSSAAPEPGRSRSVPVALGLLGLLVAVAAFFVLRDDATPSPRRLPGCAVRVVDGPITIDDTAPAFRLPGLDSGCVDLDDFRGRPVVINFWASWCNPCRREFSLLRDALEDHADDAGPDEGLAVIGIVYRDIAGDARGFAEEFGATWALALDDDSEAAAAYGVRAIPQTFFVRRDGTVARRVFGLTTRRELERHLDDIR